MAAKLPLAETRYSAQLDKTRLPTMYDLPSEDPEEPGLPDEFHYYQPQLLRENISPRGIYAGADSRCHRYESLLRPSSYPLV